MRALARLSSVVLTLAAAACAALIVAPAAMKGVAFLSIVVDEKGFLLVAAAVVGAALARLGGSRPWMVGQAVLAAATVAVALLPPVQAIRIAARRHVTLDYARYLRAPIDNGAARPAQTVVYGRVGGQTLALDVYRPAPPATQPARPVPAVIVIHGGGWSAGDKGEAPRASAWLAAQGFAVFDVQYRLAPQPNWLAAIGDVKCAIGWVKRHAQDAGVTVDPARVVLLGRSAGGHLALLAAYAPDDPALPPSCEAGDTRVAAVISFYGPTDLSWGYDHPASPRVYDSSVRLRNFLGGTPTTVPERYHLTSITDRVTAQSPPTLLLHGGHDQFVSSVHAERLAAKLDAQGIRHEALTIPYAQHGFDFISGGLGGQLAEQATLRFLADLR